MSNELISGSISGAAGVLIGQPFDFIKVQLQTQNGLPITQNRKRGFLSYFRGMSMPLLFACPTNALLFMGYSQSYSYLTRKYNSSSSSIYNPYSVVFLSGCYAGLLQAPLASVSELIKCQLQTKSYRNVQDCISSLYLQSGRKYRIFTRGMGITLFRDTFNSGCYFGSYEYILDRQDNLSKEISLSRQILAGSVAGMVAWFVIYPLDICKTIIQTQTIISTTSSLSFPSVFTNYYKKFGLRGFTFGLPSTLFRAIPVNATIFYTYEKINTYFTRI